MSKVVVTGISEIDNKLRSLPARVGKKVVTTAMKTAMKPEEQTARDLAPKKTGALARDVKIRTAKKSRKYMGIDVRVERRGDRFYGWFQETGWVVKTKQGQKRIAGKHYMRQAYEQHERQSNIEATKLIKEGILREAGSR